MAHLFSTSLEINHKTFDVGVGLVIAWLPLTPPLQMIKKSQAGGGVAVKIEHAVYQSAKMFGRHFDDKDDLLSHITRQSIDVLKVHTLTIPLASFSDDLSQNSFKADVSNEEWLLIKALKPVSVTYRSPLLPSSLVP